ncbi:MAG: serine/threonine protein kinase [Deltaproteobacteria bacterium]|nr:serine/threonine protein kinase [Deltaproteobacteria bacterium]
MAAEDDDSPEGDSSPTDLDAAEIEAEIEAECKRLGLDYEALQRDPLDPSWPTPPDEPVPEWSKLLSESVHARWMREHVDPAMPRCLFADRYELIERLGEGASAVVLRARDTKLDREVAIKLLPDITDTDTDADAWVEEARLLAKVEHPNVVAVYDAGQTPQGLYFELQLVLGHHLRHWLMLANPSWRDVLDVLVAAGRGLAAIHAAGIEHRDFKPENVLIAEDRDGVVVRVGDFGIARLLDRVPPDELKFRGTWPYMPPERVIVVEGEPKDDARSDARSDLYSFCVTLWEALYGCRPYKGTSPQELATSWSMGHLRVENPRPGVPQEIMGILRVGLAVDPAERYASMDVLLGKLREVPEVAMRKQQRRKQFGFIGALVVGWLVTMVAASRYGREASEGERMVTQVDEVEQAPTRDVDLRLAIDLAEAGRPLEAWSEFRQADERGELPPQQALDLAEILLRVAPTLRERERHIAFAASEHVANTIYVRLRRVAGAESDSNRAAGIRALANADEPSH